MFNLILKTKCIVAVISIMVVSALALPMQRCETKKDANNVAPTENNIIFEQVNFVAVTLLREKTDFLGKGQFSEYKNKHQIYGLENHILSSPDSTSKKASADYNVTVLPFYVIICALLIHTIIKYIFSKDGKKHLIDYPYLCNY